MTPTANQPIAVDLPREIGGALDWWRLSGVDCDFADEPQDWFVEPNDAARPSAPQGKGQREQAAGNTAEARQTPTVSAPRSPRIDADAIPASLEAFRAWWMESPLLEAGGLGPRVAPTGEPGTPLMVLVDMPGPDDGDALVSGAQGKLLDAMLTAFGLSRQSAYVASILPRHMPAPDWSRLGLEGYGQITLRHVSLVAPQRLLILGGHILPLIGHEPPQRSAVLRELNHEGGTVPLLASWGLPALLQRPGGKAALWRTWLEWTAR